VRKVIRLAQEMGEAFTVRAIRLDSGDLIELAFEARRLLDEAGLQGVEIFASGGLDEHEVDRIVRAGAPITGFGVGTGMGVSADAPSFDIAYKLTAYAGHGRLKLSPGKPILPGRKQVFRMEEGNRAVRDVIARAEEGLSGRPLLVPVMLGGERLPAGCAGLDDARARARNEIDRLPARVRALEPADPPYPVDLSPALERYSRKMAETVMEGSR
jgi:nicotinate phosphoribosyltransferase